MIQIKNEKFKHYDIKDVNCLYIFVCDYGLNKEDIDEVINSIGNNCYDALIVNNYDEIYIYSDNKNETVKIPKCILILIKKESIRYTNKLLTNTH